MSKSRDSKRPYLEQISGRAKDRSVGRISELKTDIVSIGRADNNDIVYHNESVSRCHAFFKRTDSGWLLQDTQSKNGIRVNHEKVPEKYLKHGDTIQIGDFVFRFHNPYENPAEKTEVIDLRVDLDTKTKPAPPAAAAPPVSSKRDRRLFGDRHVDRSRPPVWVGMGVVFALVLVGGKLLWPLRSSKPLRQLAAPGAAIPAARPLESKQEPKAAKKSTSEDLDGFLDEGKDALRNGDYDRALLAYRHALLIDPNNKSAIEGERSAGFLKQELADNANLRKSEPVPIVQKNVSPAPAIALPADDEEADDEEPAPATKTKRKVIENSAVSTAASKERAEKRKLVNDLMRTAVQALARRSYQEAIQIAEKVRRIELPKETAYLNEAKQIIDRAKLKQKEDVEPFLDLAKRKLTAGDFRGAKDLCEEMVRTDPGFADAKDCVARASRGLAGGGK